MATTTITTTNNYHNHNYQEEEIEDKSINNYKYVDELCTDISDYLEYLSELAKKEIRRSEEYNRNIDNDDGVVDDDVDDDGGDDDDDDDDGGGESDEKIQLSDSVYKFIENYKNYKNNPFPAFSNYMCKEDIDGKDVRRREGRRGGFWKYSKFDEEAFNEKIQNFILSTSSQNITKVDNINVLGLLESFYDAVITSNVNHEKVEAQDDATITKDKEISSTTYDNDDGDENSSAVRLLKSIKHNNDLIIKNNDLIKSSSFSSYLSSPEYLFNFNHLFDSSNYSKWLVSSSSFFASSLFKEKSFNSGNKNNDDDSNSDSNSDGVDNSDNKNKEITNKEGYENNDDTNNNKEKTCEDKKLVADNNNVDDNKVIQSEKSPKKQQINLEKVQFDLIEKILSYTKSEILRPQIPSILWDRWEVI